MESKSEPDTTPVFFFRPSQEYGWMSNWSHHYLIVDRMWFPTAEHYMMWRKAKLMGDETVATAIRRLEEPGTAAKAKQLGQTVKPWDEDKWIEHRESIMADCVRAKLANWSEFATRLLETGSRPVAEASPYDSIWGIGAAAATAATSPDEWRGQNLLGKTWMRIRDEERAKRAERRGGDAKRARVE